MTRSLLAVSLCAALLGAGCYSFTHESSRTSPSLASAQALGGLWATAQSFADVGAGGITQTCTNFSWRVDEFHGNSGAGAFSATCMGILNITGSAQGSVSGTSVNWAASATASGAGVPSGCTVSLAATAQLTGGQIRIPYSGTTCLGPVSGTEVLGKN